MYRYIFKRILDLLASFFLLIIISPLFFTVSVVLLYVNRGTVFFYQQRIGYKGRVFSIVKFKTMIDKYDSNGAFLPDIERITSFGRLLRSTSLDELPQLLNVFIGKMSLIGPRPLPKIYNDYYYDYEIHRHDVRPGISGWAQVNGRNYLSWEKKIEFDLYYVKNLSLMLDIKIVIYTIKNVFKGSDIGIRGVDYPDNSLHLVRKKQR